MGPDVCPWWLGYVLANPLRRLWQDPQRILGPHVRPGMRVLEPGCGMGFFTLDLARLVGPEGKVVVLDVQDRMLGGLLGRARKANLEPRVEARLVQPDGSLGLEDLAGTMDFVLLFYMLHEVQDQPRFLAQVAAAMKPGGHLLLAEPRGHVNPRRFDAELDHAREAGLVMERQPGGIRSRWALLTRP